MKKYLLPKEGTFYKANLHCHSVLSDGELTPEELKEEYKSRGYSVLAYTDHDIMISHQDLADEAFLPLNGYEMEVNEWGKKRWEDTKTCHMCLIALEPDNLKQVCWHPNDYLFANAVNYKDRVQFYEDEVPYIREYNGQCISDMMKRGREHGFFVTYNHPTWSTESYEQYSGYNYMHAMEICNYGCVVEGYEEYNPRVYDDLLRAGKRIYCIGADDNHNRGTKNTSDWDSGGAWVMIKADKLEYRTITKALEEGYFYASQGPEIHDLWMEDGRIHVNTSEAEKILFNFGNRQAKGVAAEEGQSICSASMEVEESNIYVRVTVIDHRGRIANSNAYFLDVL